MNLYGCTQFWVLEFSYEESIWGRQYFLLKHSMNYSKLVIDW